MKLKIIVLILALVIAFPGAAKAEEVGESWWQFIRTKLTYDLVQSGDYIWEATNKGLLRRSLAEPDVYRLYNSTNSGLDANQVYSLALDEKDGLWLGTDNGPMYLRADASWTYYGDSPLAGAEVRSTGVDASGGVWFGTWGHGLYYLDDEKKWSIFNADNSELVGDNVYTITPDSNGGVWFGMEGGAFHIDADGSWRALTPEDSGLVGRDVTAIAVDNEDGVWFGTHRGLAYKDVDSEWTLYNIGNSGLPSNTINSLAVSKDGSLWMGTAEGAASLTVDGEVVVSSDHGGFVKSIALDQQGNVWTGVFGEKTDLKGLEITEINRTSLEDLDHLDIPYNVITDVAVGSKGRYWIGVFGNGIAYLSESGEWVNYNTSNSILPINDVSALGVDGDDNLWIGTWGGGLVKLENDDVGTIFNMGNSSVPSDTIRSIAVDARGWVWIVTPGGVSYYEAGNWHELQLEAGLAADDIRGVIGDESGNVWFETALGDMVVYNPEGIPADLKKNNYSSDITEIAIFYNGHRIPADVPPIIEKGRTLLPIRAVSEALGAIVDWDQEQRKVHVTLEGINVELTVDEAVASVNGKASELDVPARVIDSRTLVPLRFVAESLGLDVDWDETLRTVILKEE